MDESVEPTEARREAWIAAGAYLVCGLAWAVYEAAVGQFAHPATARLLAGLFVVVNGPAVIVLIMPGRWTLILLLAFAASLTIFWTILAFWAQARGFAVGPVRFVFPAVFLGLAFLAWRAVHAWWTPPAHARA